MAQILVVDDEMGIRELLSEILTDEGHAVRLAENATAARLARIEARPDLVLLDIWMPDTDGITLLKEWVSGGQLTMPVIMMSGHGTIDTAVEATRIGALDFLEKPIALQKLLSSVKRALAKTTVHAAGALTLAAFPRSAPLRDLRKRLEQVADKSPALMLKSAQGGIVELAARTLHVPGKAWLDLTLDSAPLTLEVLQAASGGVLYVEELGRLSRLQQKNVQFAIERLEKYGMRMIAATAQDTASLLEQGWDEPLLARLSDVWLNLPSLFELRDEVPSIASHLLAQLIELHGVPPRRFSTAALNALRQYAWPGGYGELRSTVKSLALSALEEEIDADDVGNRIAMAGTSALAVADLPPDVMRMPLREAREAFERIYFEHHLRLEGGNMTRLAEKSGLERTHLYRKLKDLGLRQGKRDEGEA
ncbi:MAG: sigma-54-dependent Fis family transcriptional regulator [Betaproteobacteria bacterium]|nr:sigma-54-dependent Fis family transcriptional regulator [Betaproteobacteria bacterium]